MEKQLIISIGREYGSGGHEMAVNIARDFGLPLYDYNLLNEVAQDKNVSAQNLERYDEIPKSIFLSRTVRGFTSSPEENIAQMQFDFLRKKAANGESFVIVGRCAEKILKDYPGLVTIFVLGDIEKKVERISKMFSLTPEEALRTIKNNDKKRKTYHNYYCTGKWGDSRNYDFSINSSKLGIPETTQVIEDYIKRRQKQA